MIPFVDVPYEEKIHKALTDKVEGFSLPLDAFKEKLKDPEYQAKIHKALSDKVEGFSVPIEDFQSKFKKKSPFPVQEFTEPSAEDLAASSAKPAPAFNEEEDKQKQIDKLGQEFEGAHLADGPKVVTPFGDLGNIKPSDKELTDEQKKELFDHPTTSVREAANSFAGSFNQPFVDLVASAPKAAAFIKKGIDELAGAKSKPIQDYDAYKIGDWIEKKALDIGVTATDPKVEDTFLGGKAPHALGGALSLIMTGGTSGGSSAVAKELMTVGQGGVKTALKELGTHIASRAGLAGGNQMGISEFEQAKAAGASDEEAFGVYLKNFGVGTTAAIPISRGFARINQFTGGGIVSALKKSATQGLEMGIQGGVQTYLTNKIAQGSYDPEREPYKNLLESVGVQMFVGMVLPGIQGAYKKMSPKQVQETKANIHQALKDYESAQEGPTEEGAKAIEASKTIDEPVNPDSNVLGHQIQPGLGQIPEPVSKSAPSKVKSQKKTTSQFGNKSQSENISQNAPRETLTDEPAEPTTGNVRDETNLPETGVLPDNGGEKPGTEEINREEPINLRVDKQADTGAKVKFEWLGQTMSGEILGVNDRGRIRIKGDDGTIYPVGKEAIQKETNSVIPKKTSKSVKEGLDELVKANTTKNPVKVGGIVAATINPFLPLKKLWVGANKAQEAVLGKISRSTENWIAKKAAQGLQHNNYFIRNTVGTLQNLIGGLSYTEGSLSNKLEYMGNKNAGHLRTHQLNKEMYGIIDSDPASLLNVHTALDPETYVSTLPEGKTLLDESESLKRSISGKQAQLTKQMNSDPEDIAAVDKIERELEDAQDALVAKKKEIDDYTSQIGKDALSKLNTQEKALHDLIRKTNDFVHDWHHDQQLISDETYEKFKGKYIARLYEEFELTPPDVESAYQSSRPDFNIFKERQDFNKIQQSLVRDPVYLTSKRLGQMLQTQALFDYAESVKASKDITVSDEQFPNSTQMGQPGKPFYGKLTGKFVPNYIAQDMKGFFFANKMNQDFYSAFRGYDKNVVRQFLKRSHTVYNPIVQLGNKASNYAFASWAGIDPMTFTINKFRAAKQLNSQSGNYYHEAMGMGLLGTDLLSNDLKPFSQSAPSPKPTTTLGKVVKAVKSLPKKAEEFYGRADDEAKLSAYMSLREDYGYSAEKSGQVVYESFQNYATVGKLYDFAAKTPIVGNPYIKFKADLARIIKNGMTRRPLTTAAWVGSLYALSNYLSKESGEDEKVKAIRERREFQPKITTPFGNVPLSWQVPHVGEVNFARFISPFYAYDKGDKDNMVSDVTGWLPYQWDEAPSPSKDLSSVLPGFNDVFLGTYAQALTDRDFRGKSVQDPEGSKYLTRDSDPGSRILNAMNYISRSQIPMFAGTEDMMKAYNGEADYFGRERTVSQAILNNIIKVQEFGAPQARETLTKEIKYKVSKFEGLSRDIGSVKSDANKRITKILSSDKSEEIKNKLVQNELDHTRKSIADKMEEQVKLIKEIEEPSKLLKSIEGIR